MEKILKEIKEGKYLHEPTQRKNISNISSYWPDVPKKTEEERKKGWEKIEKIIQQGHKINLHKESQVRARRTYEYYSLRKGDWTGPSCQQFLKISKFRYGIKLSLRNGEFFEENSSLNKRNLEEYQIAPNHQQAETLGEIFFIGLEMEQELSLVSTADLPIPTADPPMLTADPPMPTAEPPAPSTDPLIPSAEG